MEGKASLKVLLLVQEIAHVRSCFTPRRCTAASLVLSFVKLGISRYRRVLARPSKANNNNSLSVRMNTLCDVSIKTWTELSECFTYLLGTNGRSKYGIGCAFGINSFLSLLNSSSSATFCCLTLSALSCSIRLFFSATWYTIKRPQKKWSQTAEDLVLVTWQTERHVEFLCRFKFRSLLKTETCISL